MMIAAAGLSDNGTVIALPARSWGCFIGPAAGGSPALHRTQ